VDWPGPIYAESTSGLREIKNERLLVGGDRVLVHAMKEKQIDGVVRIGGVPTARLWRNLESSEFPVFSISSRPFAGLSRGEFFHTDLSSLTELRQALSGIKFSSSPLMEFDREQDRRRVAALNSFPSSEPALVEWISRQIPGEATVYLGNSLPIREWDLFASREREVTVLANRGANGIDGQLSTALAHLSSEKPLWVILGDLTTLYDSNALWFWKTNPQPLTLVVINNSGGQIFSRMFASPLFRNSHDLDFSSWARQWNLPYQSLSKPAPLDGGSKLIELRPDGEQTLKYWRNYDSLWG
jgi:2-succinyl-5-enolpyruvyl-6-hydroxy-3-cyclohexene-1-carboxylate synthase